MPAQDTTPKVPRVQKIAVICHGAFVARAEPHYLDKTGKERQLDKSGDIPVGQSTVFDLSKAADITTGSKIWPKFDVVAGHDVAGVQVEYAPNGQTITYVVKGVTWNPWVEFL